MSPQEQSNPWVVRTDFSDDSAWALVRERVSAPQTDALSGMAFTAHVRFVDDSAFENQSPQDIVRSLPDDYPGLFVFVVDEQTIREKEHSLLVVGFLPQEEGRDALDRKANSNSESSIKTFRAIPSTIQSIENNLSIANMDFEDFAKAVESDGVFRGFRS